MASLSWQFLNAFDVPVDATPEAETVTYHDFGSDRQGFACFHHTRLVGVLFLASSPVAVSRDWACAQLLVSYESQRARMAVTAGRPVAEQPDRGAIVCSCFGVGVNEVDEAAAKGCRTLEAVGHALSAGTNCGSCRGEISRIIEKQQQREANLLTKVKDKMDLSV